RLEDVDFGDRRLTIGGRTRPLDDLTRQALLDYLASRRGRSPQTANPHVIVSQHTAYEMGPISSSRFREAAPPPDGTSSSSSMERGWSPRSLAARRTALSV